MTRPPSSRLRLSLALIFAVPGCLVSFADYPLGDLRGAASGGTAGDGGTTAAAGSTASESGSSTSGGSDASAAGARDAGGADGTDGGASALGAAPSMIDDFEDGDGEILPNEGRRGAWYSDNDGTGTQTPRTNQALLPSLLNPARDGSKRGLHTSGGPFSSWGALIGTSLTSSRGAAQPYDLSRYSGIRLWLRSGGTSTTLAKRVRVNLLTPATTAGGGCSVCGDNFGAEAPLTSEWQLVEVLLSSMKQQGFGMPRLTSPDLKRVTGLQLAFPKNVSFDLWVDDIELF